MTSKPSRLVSLRVSEGDYAKLEEQSAALGLKPAVLARVLIRASLNAPEETRGRHSRRQVASVLERIDKHAARSHTPAVDAVALIREMRDARDDQMARAILRSRRSA